MHLNRLWLRPLLVLFGLLGGSPLTAADRPNVLFVIADDWGREHAGAYGCSWVKTPAFDRVAKEGILFRNCFTNNPKCSPCRASILTGRNSWQLQEAMCHNGLFRADWPVYPDLLEQAGYFVGYTGKGWGPGDFKGGGFKRNPAGPVFNRVKTKSPYSGMSNIDYAANFAEFLTKRAEGQPFYFWYGATEPHQPYEIGSGIRSGKNPGEVTLPKFLPNNPTIRSDYLDYALEVEWFDSQLGKILKMLEANGELDNTLILVTSDHGEPFPRVKGQIYDRGFHIPLAVRWGKQIRPGRTVDDFINVRDYMPTLLEVCGVPIPKSVTGRSFANVLKSEKSGWIDPTRNRMLIGKERHDTGRPHDQGYPVRAIRTPEYLYVRNYEPDRWPVGNPETGYTNCDDSPTKTKLLHSFDRFYMLCFGKRPAEELYRVDTDPDCIHNLAEESSLAKVKAELKTEMEKLLKADADPRALGKGDIFDTYKYLGKSQHTYEQWLKFNKNE